MGFTIVTRKYIRSKVITTSPANISMSVFVRFSINLRTDSLMPIVFNICMVLVRTFFRI